MVKPATKRTAKAKTSKAKTSKTKTSKTKTSTPKPMHVVVVGAGRMGADIALNFVIAGWHCDVIEPDAKVRERATAYWQRELKRLRKAGRGRKFRLHADGAALEWPAVDLVVESVFENLN